MKKLMRKLMKKFKFKIKYVIVILLIILMMVPSVNITKKLLKISENKNIKQYSYNEPYIPEGFLHVEGTTVDNGYVIQEISTGNEFVWIPVDGTNVKLERRNFSVSDLTKEQCKEELNLLFKESVNLYGGFYIARYEAGIPEGKTYEGERKNVSGKPVSKKNQEIWNYISYNNAETSASEMYAESSEITSSLMNGEAWDTVLTWIEQKGYNVGSNSSIWGNYLNNPNTNGKVEKTGGNESWVAQNIYDLAGNVSEWTTEENGSSKVRRGGNYTNEGTISPVGMREKQSKNQYNNTTGFRVMIYKTGEFLNTGYDTPFIPTGFEYLEGEWNTGYVIKDTTNGNEFVWVPVDGNEIKLKRQDFSDSFATIEKATEKLDPEFKISVNANGGFYIARYESGEGRSDTGETLQGNVQGKPVSKKGINVWTNISQTQAEQNSKEMYLSHTEIRSRLINSYAYDMTMQWLENSEINVRTDSSSWGNYSTEQTKSSKMKTGAKETNKVNNIYDLAGNVWELTTEKYNEGIDIVARGGDYLSTGSALPAGIRDVAKDTDTYDYMGYRTIIYKKVSGADLQITTTEPIVATTTTATKSAGARTLTKETPCYINFTATLNADGGTCTISPELPYKVFENGTYKFTITGTYEDLTTTKEIEVIVNQYKSALELVKYDAGEWTQEEIAELQSKSLYNINTSKSVSSATGLNFTFGGFTYKGDTTNSNYINDRTIITSRNQSVAPQSGYGTPGYDGWQILESEERDGKTYVTKIMHAGSPENFVFYYAGTNASYRAEYILSNGTRQTGYSTYKPRNWDMYKDQSQLNLIEEVHAMTYDEAFAITGSKAETSGIRKTGAYYWIASAKDNTFLYKVENGGYLGTGCYYCYGVRPVVTLKSDVYIVSGSGVEGDPYVLGKELKIETTEPIVNTSKTATSSAREGTLTKGTEAYINFTATLNAEGGTCTISPELPYKVYGNGIYKFTVTGTYEGETVTKEVNVKVNQYAGITGLVQYDAGEWTQAEISELKNKSLYNINTSKTASSTEGLNFTFGGFTYKGDTSNTSYINSGTVITSRNQSVSHKSGTPSYEGWQILESEERNGKTYVTKIMHAGSPENFVFYKSRSSDSYRAEYILSNGARRTTYNTYQPRSWDMYKDKNQLNLIKEVHAMTYDEAYAITGNTSATSGIRRTGALYWLANASDSSYLKAVHTDGNIGGSGNTTCWGVRPVVTLNSGVYIVSGSGFEGDPYVLGIE